MTTEEIRLKVRRAILTASPSDVEEIARRVGAEILGEEIAIPEIADIAQSLIGGTITPRASMYADAIWSTHEQQQLERERDNGVILGRRVCEKDGASCEECVSAATEEFIPLDQLEEIGSLQCMNNCRCEFEFGDEDSSFATSEVFQGVVGGQDKFGGSETIQ